MSVHNVIRCSDYEYLILYKSFELASSNISCPNNTKLFENPSLIVYNWTEALNLCFDNNKTYSVISHLLALNPTDKNQIKKQVKLLSGTINVANHTYPFEAKWPKQKSPIIIDQGSHKWSSDGLYIFYMTFTNLSIICRMKMNLSDSVKSGKCVEGYGTQRTICYHELLLKPSIKNVNWTLLSDFIDDKTYYPNNWNSKDGYYLDLRLLNIQTTSVSC
jgi:hypothetical protein